MNKKPFSGFTKGLGQILYHVAIVGLSALLALSLPLMVHSFGRHISSYRSLIGDEKIFMISIEMGLAILFILLFNVMRRNWRDRKFSRMAQTAGIVSVTPAKGFLARRKIRRWKEEQGFARDIMVISSTGSRTFVDPKGELHQVLQSCREAKIMLLNPKSAGTVVRAKSIPDPDVTPESFAEQIRKSIAFLKSLKASQKNIRLKLYADPPFLKMTILGDYIWLQYYQTGLDIRSMPKYVFKHDSNTDSLYLPFYQYFVTRWNNPEVPEYDLETDELVYRDEAGNEVRRENSIELKRRTHMKTDTDSAEPAFPPNDQTMEDRRSLSLWSPQHSCPDDLSPGPIQRSIFHTGLHPGGKKFSALRHRHPVCETAGWIALR